MKQIFFVSLFLLLAVFLIPLAVIPDEPLISVPAVDGDDNGVPYEEAVPYPSPADDYPSPEPEEATASFDESIYVTVSISGAETDLTLREYLRGVLAGEIPASFPEEALKAQAVAARTYIMRDPDLLFCDDPGHCMAYSTGFDSRLDAAVEMTDGEVLVYDGEPILAVFFSAASGRTENAADVWGGEYPYLIAVDSAGDEASPRWSDTVTVAQDDFWAAVDLPRSDTPFGTVTRTPSGGVSTIEIGGVEIRGTEIRRLFGLNSINFTAALIGGSVVFETKGHGHGVGMPQWGARAMALNGAGYGDILWHYYTDTRLERLPPP